MGIKRENVSKKDTWNLEALFANPKDWEDEFLAVKSKITNLSAFQEKLGDEKVLLACCKLISEIDCRIETLNTYASNKANEDLGNSKNKRRKNRVRDLFTEFSEGASFFEPELLKYGKNYLFNLMNEESFSDFRMLILGIIRSADHTLSEKEEALLASLAMSFLAPNDIYSMATNVDMRFEGVDINGKTEELTEGNFYAFMISEFREVRKAAACNIFNSYKAQRGMLSESLNAHVKSQVSLAKVRGYNHVLDKFLHRNNIPRSVCDSLFKVTSENLYLLHRYLDIRKRLLKVPSLRWYDLYIPIVDSVDKKYSYEEAVALVCESLKPLGNKYIRTLKKGITSDGWVDKYENEGKRSGAYSSNGYVGMPYILLNFTEKLNDVFTLTHEGGHSMHSLLAKDAQPYDLYDYSIFMAEIASIFNENLLNEHLLLSDDKKIRAYILNNKLESIRTTFFRQTMFAEFEALLYKTVWNGRSLDADFLEEEYLELNKRYFGPGLVINDMIRHEWSRIPHFYYNFYMYQYATGLACSNYFSKQVLEGGNKERENYLGILKAGGSNYPEHVLKAAGLDITKTDYLNAVMEDFKITLDEFEKLMF